MAELRIVWSSEDLEEDGLYIGGNFPAEVLLDEKVAKEIEEWGLSIIEEVEGE